MEEVRKAPPVVLEALSRLGRGPILRKYREVPGESLDLILGEVMYVGRIEGIDHTDRVLLLFM